MTRTRKKHQQLLTQVVTVSLGLLALTGGLIAWRIASAADKIPTGIEIAGTTFNPADGDKAGAGWSYHKDSNILTLDNFNSDKDILAHNGDLRVKLIGNNLITNKGMHAGEKVIIEATSTGKLTIDVDGFSRALIGTGQGYVQNGGTVELKQELNGKPVTKTASLLFMDNGGLEVNGTANLIVRGENDGSHSLCGTHALNAVDYRFNTSGKVEFHMRSTQANDSNTIAVCGWAQNPQAKKAILLGSGQYSFEAPVIALKVPVEVRNGQEIAEPAGATIAPDGTITGVTNLSKIVFKKAAVQSVLAISGGTADKPSPVKEGETVTITADAPATGYEFDKWVVKKGGIALADATQPVTTFTMPAEEVEVEATYKLKKYTVNVTCGTHGTCQATPAGPQYDFDSELKINIQADAGYVIDTIKRNSIVIDQYSQKDIESVEIVTNVRANANIEVSFKQKPAVILPPAPEVSTNKPTLSQKDMLTVEVKNLAPEHQGKTLDIFINSTKTKLASLTVNAQVMTKDVTIPCSIEAGSHTITAEINGVQVGSAIALTVAQNAACQTVAQTNQPAQPNQNIKTPNSGYKQNSISIVAIIAAVGALLLAIFVSRKLAKK